MKDYIKVWDNIAPKFSKSILKDTHPDNEKQLLRELKKGSSVLEVGCANGKYVSFLSRHGFKAVGIDISEKMIEIAKKELKKNKLNAKFFVMDATRLYFSDKSFDYLISTGNVLGSIPGSEQRIKALKEMMRVTRKKIILELVKSDSIEETKARYNFLDESESYIVKRWSEEEILKILKSLDCSGKIIKGRKALIADYFFYVIINLEQTMEYY